MSLRIGMVHWNLPEEGKKAWGVGVAVHELANALVQAGNFVLLQPPAKGCYL